MIANPYNDLSDIGVFNIKFLNFCFQNIQKFYEGL